MKTLAFWRSTALVLVGLCLGLLLWPHTLGPDAAVSVVQAAGKKGIRESLLYPSDATASSFVAGTRVTDVVAIDSSGSANQCSLYDGTLAPANQFLTLGMPAHSHGAVSLTTPILLAGSAKVNCLNNAKIFLVGTLK